MTHALNIPDIESKKVSQKHTRSHIHPFIYTLAHTHTIISSKPIVNADETREPDPLPRLAFVDQQFSGLNFQWNMRET